jgi:predicted ATPase with chaperone activity
MDAICFEAPETISEIGINRTLLEELALKALFLHGEMSLADLADRMCLSLPVVEEIFQILRREQLCEVKGMARGTHIISASAMGKERGSDLFAFSNYSGPAPVSLEDYSARVRAQSLQNALVQPKQLERAFQQLVLNDDFLSRLGTAVVSGTSIFLYGPPGTGKTTLACNIPAIYEDAVLIPYAIEVDRQIIAVYDPGVHYRLNQPIPEDWDRRWVLCHRPRVITGGELSGEMLDLQFNSTGRFFTAPLQLKANNGVLVVDDFGRQRMRPDELLNRWMTPLDRRIDFLSLPGGRKFESPFDVLVVFSTNLEPRSLADEAFLRRIPNKINVPYASPEQFAEIFEKECIARKIRCEEGLAEYVVELIAGELKQTLSHSHARDIVNQVFWSATYRGVEPTLNQSTLKQACYNYFLPTSRV